MKSKLLILGLLLIAGTWSSESSSGKTESGRIWIFFKDRPYIEARTLHPAQVTDFKAASIHRREQRATVRWAESDFAVDPQYIKSLKDAGATIHRESRWLNGVSARCDARCREIVSSLRFVSELRPVRTYRRQNEVIEEARELQSFIPSEATALSYGASKNQLLQIKVPQVHNKGFAGEGEIDSVRGPSCSKLSAKAIRYRYTNSGIRTQCFLLRNRCSGHPENNAAPSKTREVRSKNRRRKKPPLWSLRWHYGER